MKEEKKQTFWKKITEKIPSPVKKVLTGVALFLTSQTAYSTPAATTNAEKDLQVLDPIETFEHYKNNASPIGIITYFETHGSGTNGLLPPAATKNSSGKYFGLIQMSPAVRKLYYNTLKQCVQMSNEEFAQKYCLTEKCNDEQISYLKEGCLAIVRAIGDQNASSVYAHQKAAKKYPYFSAITQELFDCGDFYAPAIEKINKKIAEEGVDFKFEQLHPAIQFASFRILALGQEGYAPKIGKSIAQCIKNDSNAINYITAKEINQKMKDGLLKDILKPRPKVIKIIDSLETKPLEYWMESEYLYNAANGGSSDSSWFGLREKEIKTQELTTLQEKRLKEIQVDTCEAMSLDVVPNYTQELTTLQEKRLKEIQVDTCEAMSLAVVPNYTQEILDANYIIAKKRQHKSNINLAQSNDEQITITLNGEGNINEATIHNKAGKKLTSRFTKKQLKKAKELAELQKNPAYLAAVKKAYNDRRA